MNALETTLTKNGFDKVEWFTKRDAWGKDDISFTHTIKSHLYETYTLSLQLERFGSVQEVYIIWEKYEKCVEQLQEAIDWMEKCKKL